MLNYHNTYRESLDRTKHRPTPKKQPTINRSHTSSINLKLSTQLQHMKGSNKNLKQNNDPSRKYLITHSKSKPSIKNQHTTSTSQLKCSYKIKQDSDFSDGSRVRMKTNYQQSSCLKPFRQSNRCLITQRNEKISHQYKFCEKSQTKRKDSHLRTQYKQSSEHQDYSNNDIYTKYEENQLKLGKQVSSKYNAQSTNSSSNTQMVKVSVNQLKKLFQQYKHYENEAFLLQKQLNFYRKTASKLSKNSVLRVLAQQ